MYGNWKTVYNRHRRWSSDRTWERILDELRRGADQDEGSAWTVGIDAGVVRAHQHAAGARHLPTSKRRSSQPPMWAQGARPNDTKSGGKPRREALGRSRGGLTTKIRLAADTRCRPISRVTTAGHRHDCLAFDSVMTGIRIRRRGRGRPRTRPGRVLGDKAYSNRAIRSHLRRHQIKASIPEPASQPTNRLRRASKGGQPPQFDAEIYQQRNVVERCINKLKGYRAVASCYDKRDYMYRGTVDIASIRIWPRDPVP